ncbi:MAG: penicillin-binding protein 2 [Candidatus Delongbacteria bacterium]|nr:penicillin-binding protein 2 [Candidatus Delongbacteria bacterium]MCG2760889.1 penicillin-binding protein 2 [Candidatus Delongbacteria bacterium]
MNTSRIKIFYRLSVLFFIIIIIRVIYLQYFDTRLKERSELNRVRTIVIEPSRGRIFDRNGSLIIDNQYAYNLYVIPEQFIKSERSINFISGKLKIHKDSIVSELTSPEVYQDRFFRLMRDIDFSVYSNIAEKGKELRGVVIKKEWTRKFIVNTAPHIIGYLGEAKEREELSDQTAYGDLIGKEGIEYIYDDILRGEKGFIKEIKDVKGNKISDYKKEEWKEAVKGKDVYLTIDLELQQFVEKLLEGKSGTAIVQDSNNGEILALASKPDYPLDIFSRKLSKDEWEKWSEDPGKPLYNKAIMGLYPPGSVIKMATSLAAAEQNIKTINDKVNCPGGMQIGNRFIRCWNRTGGHGDVNMTLAIMMSCDTYFYDTALKINIDKWKNTLEILGFGKKTGIDLKYERSGLVPGEKYYRKRIQGDLTGRYANLMIGQGEILTTPLQIANHTSMLANGGIRLTPHLFYKCGEENDFRYYKKNDSDTVKFDNKVLNTIRKAMYHVVNTAGGTAFSAKSNIIEFAGKTGTAQNPHGGDHAWFTSYGPYTDTEITVTVFEEYGLHGTAAAHIAKDIYEFWILNKKAPK